MIRLLILAFSISMNLPTDSFTPKHPSRNNILSQDSSGEGCTCCHRPSSSTGSSSATPIPKAPSVTPVTDRSAMQRVVEKRVGYTRESPNYTPKRSDYVSWDDYHMATALLSAHRSKDPNSAAGSCLVDDKNRIVGTGYSGFPSIDDDLLPWTPSDNLLHSAHAYSVPAEINAILNTCAASCEKTRLYTLSFPNHEAAKMIVQSGVVEVVYREAVPEQPSESIRASQLMFQLAGVQTRQYSLVGTVTIEYHADPSEEETKKSVDLEPPAKRFKPEDLELLQKEAGYDPIAQGSSKREDYLSWDQYFMAMAFLTAQRSKDPNTQVGACIVDASRRILGLGYNGFPRGCDDDVLPWARKGDFLQTKYPFVCHAEVNAILNKGTASLKGSTLYVALFPCNECAKMIIQAGIREVVYLHDKYRETAGCRASRVMFGLAGVQLRQMGSSLELTL